MAVAALSQPDEEAQLLAAPGGTAGAAQVREDKLAAAACERA